MLKPLKEREQCKMRKKGFEGCKIYEVDDQNEQVQNFEGP